MKENSDAENPINGVLKVFFKKTLAQKDTHNLIQKGSNRS